MSRTTRSRNRALGTALGLVAALGATAVLLTSSPDDPPAAPAGPVAAAAAWPGAQRADLPGNLADGPVWNPMYFLDARTSVGTAPDAGGEQLRLLVRAADGAIRELRRMRIDAGSQFAGLTADGDVLAWAETAAGGRTSMWTVDLRTGTAPRRLTSDTGKALFYDSQYDLVIADGRLHWAAAANSATDPSTEVRSVALTGGPVAVREEPGEWAMSAWPWLVDGFGDRTGTTRLRNMVTFKEVKVPGSGAELVTCSPAWCRVLVMQGGGLARIDLMRPDGSDRVRAAGGTAAAAITDVAVLDRFEVLSETGPETDLTGTARLLVFDSATGGTVDLAPDAQSAAYRGGVLWWSTGDQDNTQWHTLDLRTV
ncbi:MAG TPA: hypothetical protein VFO77_09395 [Actinoplanes sp.]|nr:hypothetical protein [Actinoplanes sp.]